MAHKYLGPVLVAPAVEELCLIPAWWDVCPKVEH
jgi:hypothetical protein